METKGGYKPSTTCVWLTDKAIKTTYDALIYYIEAGIRSGNSAVQMLNAMEALVQIEKDVEFNAQSAGIPREEAVERLRRRGQELEPEEW